MTWCNQGPENQPFVNFILATYNLVEYYKEEIKERNWKPTMMWNVGVQEGFQIVHSVRRIMETINFQMRSPWSWRSFTGPTNSCLLFTVRYFSMWQNYSSPIDISTVMWYILCTTLKTLETILWVHIIYKPTILDIQGPCCRLQYFYWFENSTFEDF